MQDINVNFMHPRYGTVLNVDLDATITAEEAVRHLTQSGFVPAHNPGYQLAYAGSLLESQTRFGDLDFSEGNVIRVIPLKKNTQTQLRVHIKHPHKGLMTELHVEPQTQAQSIITQLLSRGFIAPNEKGYRLIIREDLQLEPTQSFADAGVNSEDFIRIESLDAPSTPPLLPAIEKLQEMLGTLQTQSVSQDAFEDLRQELHHRFERFEQSQSPESMVAAVHAKAQWNPTAEIFEDTDTLIRDIHFHLDSEAPKKVSDFNPLPWIIVVILAVLLMLTLVFWSAIKMTLGI